MLRGHIVILRRCALFDLLQVDKAGEGGRLLG